MSCKVRLLAVAMLGLACSPAWSADRAAANVLPSYRIVVLPAVPDALSTVATDISDAGQIVGYTDPSSGTGSAVSWGVAPYAPQRLAHLTPRSDETASAVNDAGFVVGIANLRSGNYVAVMWNPDGTIVALGSVPHGPIRSIANDINGSGLVAGRGTTIRVADYIPVSWSGPGAPLHVLDIPGSRFAGAADAANDFGDIAGYYYYQSSNIHAARWSAGQQQFQDLGDLPGGADISMANGINNAGQVVGHGNSELFQRAVLWDSDGTMTDLGAIPGAQGFYDAIDIDPVGKVLGSFTNDHGHRQGFLWTAQDGMVALHDLIDPADPLRARFGASDVTVYAINASGLIVGSMYVERGNPDSSAIVLVPEE